MASLKRAIEWDERRYGLELDLDRFMIVASNDFNMGAMENKGLNIFNAKYILASPTVATDDDYMNVESIVGHEYFHNWTGNRVTCRDWFQLSLKEGLTVFRDQEFSADMLGDATSRAVKRIEDVRTLRATQFPEDGGPMAHPVRPDSYQEISNFYTATVYEKGAEVVRMLQTLVGVDGFRRGMDLYFKRHDGQAVTCDDFVAAIADANGRDLTQFKRWYSQAGTPRVRVETRYDAHAYAFELTLSQSTPATPGQSAKQPFHIPFAVGLIAGDGRDMPLQLEGELAAPSAPPRTKVLDLTQAKQTFRFINVGERPVPSLLRNFSAPVIVEHRYSDAELAFLSAHDSDAFNRWEAGQRLAIATLMSLTDAVESGPAAGTRRLRCGDVARDAARSSAIARLQGASAAAARRKLHRRAAQRCRSRSDPRGAALCDARARAAAWPPTGRQRTRRCRLCCKRASSIRPTPNRPDGARCATFRSPTWRRATQKACSSSRANSWSRRPT